MKRTYHSYMNRVRMFLSGLFLLLINSQSVDLLNAQDEVLATSVAEEQRVPSWLLLEKGKDRAVNGFYSEALRLFIQAKKQSIYAPEADYRIGMIYNAENNFEMAVTQFQKAINNKDFLYNPKDIYEIYLLMADSYYRMQNWVQYEAALVKAIYLLLGADTQTFTKERQARNILQAKGLDSVMLYYNQQFPYVQKALNEISLYYYKKGYYNDSISYNLYAIVSTLAQGIEYLKTQNLISEVPQTMQDLYLINPEYTIGKLEVDLKHSGLDFSFKWNRDDLKFKDPEIQVNDVVVKIREVNPEYKFTLLGYYLYALELYAPTASAIQQNFLYRQLYFLATSLSIQGYRETAREIFHVLAYSSNAQQWQARARSQLRQAYIDKQVPLGIL